MIHFVDSTDDVTRARRDLLETAIAGIDVEWPQNRPASLFQIATPDHVYLFDLLKLGHDVEFHSLVRDLVKSSVVLLAFSCHGDVAKLREASDAFDGLTVKRFVDLAEDRSLADVTKDVLGVRLSKREQCSNWAQRPLTPSQRRYAALDAYVLLAIAGADPVLPSWFPMRKVTDFSSSIVVLAKSLGLVSGELAVIAVLPIHRQLDLARLAQCFDDDKVFRLAPVEDLVALFGYERGRLGPIGRTGCPVILDASLRDHTIACGCGDPDRHLVFAANDLVAYSPSGVVSNDDDDIPRYYLPPSRAVFAEISSEA